MEKGASPVNTDVDFMKVPPKEIIGQHVKLRPVTIHDVEPVHEYAADPEVCRYLFWGPRTEMAQAKRHIQRILGRYAYGEADICDWAIERLDDEQFLGKASLHSPEGDSVRLAVVLNRMYWGQGYGTEITKMLIRAALEDYGFRKVVGSCRIENLASDRMMQKAGMTFVGVVHNYEVRKGVERDSRVYEVCRNS